MNNHTMYFYDKQGELALTRCCFCKFMHHRLGEMKCRRGHDCTSEECVDMAAIEKNKITRRFAVIRIIRKRAALNFHNYALQEPK